MVRHWTFGQKIAAAFAALVLVAATIGAVGVYTARRVVAEKDRVIDVNAQLLSRAQALRAASDGRTASLRGYLLLRDPRFIQEQQDARVRFEAEIGALRRLVYTDEGRRQLAEIERTDTEVRAASDRVVSLRQTQATADAAIKADEEDVLPKRRAFDQQIDTFVSREQTLLTAAEQAATDNASAATFWLVVIVIVAALGATAVAFALTRTLSRQIGAAVGQVQSSSAELQAAATQQATGSREQSIAMSEISTTISELLATSRQITDSAQQVAKIAEQTANAARSGDDTVEATHDSIAGIRRHVDLIVGHMLELGKKSQQIGAVLDIVSELAEQTNILAINATIEAAGAGEGGRRFAVVAEEIRKLADRVAGSTKEIRGLIDDVRSAVNTTVMATETGSKAVDAGSKQFGHVAASFKQIADLVVTTTEAAREIELSTKQQMTAVEQVNVAIANVTQASKETETSSGQTQQTASELAVLSRDLLRLVQPRVAAM
ncbi:MAG TPA: methyl-accepting chemotaxis protein [Vicinamibacterales bacterium]|nr:methyl-accepting chemotaxis protein [Vicinamibacterales bacterium]